MKAIDLFAGAGGFSTGAGMAEGGKDQHMDAMDVRAAPGGHRGTGR